VEPCSIVGPRFPLRVAAMGVLLASLFTAGGCAVDRMQGPVVGPAAPIARPVRHAIGLREVTDSLRMASLSTVAMSGLCNIGDFACGYTDIERHWDWEAWFGTYVQGGRSGRVKASSTLKVYRGGSFFASSNSSSCGWLILGSPDTCGGWVSVLSTCESQRNRVEGETEHIATTYYGLNYRGESSDSDGCPTPPCAEDEEADYILADVDIGASPDAVCSEGGGGGGGPTLSCRSEWDSIEISYDGGASWELFWEGWVEVCEYVE
jgi:hypothetical protein